VARRYPVRILGKRVSKYPEFQKEYLNLVDEKLTSVMTSEMERLVRELLRDTEIVALFRRISDELQDPAIALALRSLCRPFTGFQHQVSIALDPCAKSQRRPTRKVSHGGRGHGAVVHTSVVRLAQPF
jgi:hypothetical protein